MNVNMHKNEMVNLCKIDKIMKIKEMLDFWKKPGYIVGVERKR